MNNSLAIIEGDIYAAKDGFIKVLTDRNINFEKEAGFAIQLLQNSDYLLKVGLANRQSVVDAVTNVAAIGISLNPAKKQAYLVPRDGKVCLDISYMGLLDLAIASGSILWGQAEIVRATDVFALNGFDKPPTHSFNPFAPDRGDIIGAYVVVKTVTGDYLTTSMPIAEIYDIRDRSEAWKKKQAGPWKTDPGEMIKKTVIKRAQKTWPKTDRLKRADHYLNTDGGEGIHFDHGNVLPSIAGATNVDVEALISEAKKTTTDEAALAYWRSHNAKLTNQPADHKKLKAVIMAHRAKLREQAEADAKRTVEMPQAQPDQTDPAPPAQEPKPAVDDDFVRQMDAASGQQNDYTPE
jgi:recombination protein RecT